jgi:hypothetical protein
MYGSMNTIVHFTGPSLSEKLTPLPPKMEEEEEEDCADATKLSDGAKASTKRDALIIISGGEYINNTGEAAG